jgi:hypothetical protein
VLADFFVPAMHIPAFCTPVDKTDAREEILLHETTIVSLVVCRARGCECTWPTAAIARDHLFLDSTEDAMSEGDNPARILSPYKFHDTHIPYPYMGRSPI